MFQLPILCGSVKINLKISTTVVVDEVGIKIIEMLILIYALVEKRVKIIFQYS
jgi:hypothetical protein